MSNGPELFYKWRAAAPTEPPARQIEGAQNVFRVMQRIETVVIGAGQCGLAMSARLREAGCEHVVLERGQVAQAWRDRWDSLTLLSPNWFTRLPGHAYDGDDPDGFMGRDDIVRFFADYASRLEAPIECGFNVSSVEPAEGSAQAGISSVVWATGYRRDFGWIRGSAIAPGRDPSHVRGVSTQPGLYFLGLRWLYTRRSNFIDGAGADAAYVRDEIVRRAGRVSPASRGH